jgi:hypothetical protein
VALVDTITFAFTAIRRPPNRWYAVLFFRAVGRLRCLSSPWPPPSNGALIDHGATGGENSKAFVESYLLSFRSRTASNGVPPSVVCLVNSVFEELVGCVLSFRGRPTQGASAEAAWAALLLLQRLVLRQMADFTSTGDQPPDPVGDYRDYRIARWALGDLDTLFSTARANASLTNERTPPRTSLPRDGTDPMSTLQPFHNGVSAKVAIRTVSLPAVGEYRRAVDALNSNPVIASVRGVHEKLSRLHPQNDDDLADALADPFSLPRIKLHASDFDIMEVVARCPIKSSPHVDGWRFETLCALGSPCTLTGLAEAIVNAEVPPCVASFLASATLIPLDKLDHEQRRAQEQALCDQKGALRPI